MVKFKKVFLILTGIILVVIIGILLYSGVYSIANSNPKFWKLTKSNLGFSFKYPALRFSYSHGSDINQSDKFDFARYTNSPVYRGSGPALYVTSGLLNSSWGMNIKKWREDYNESALDPLHLDPTTKKTTQTIRGNLWQIFYQDGSMDIPSYTGFTEHKGTILNITLSTTIYTEDFHKLFNEILSSVDFTN